MTDALVLLLIGSVAAIPVPIVMGRVLWQARSYWLLGLLCAGSIWLAPRELWLACIALWFLVHWPTAEEPHTLLPSVVTWVGVGLSWGLLRSVPREVLEYAPWGWLLVAWFNCGLLVYRKYKHGHRATGTLGSPVLTALSLALVAPFCPWWGWPLLAAGLVITCSWTAIGALTVGMTWLHPGSLPYTLATGLAVAFLWCWSPSFYGRRLLEWTPRGDTVDFVIARWRAWRIAIHHSTWRGHGPETMEPAMLRWWSRYGVELPAGELHNDPLHLVYEYGVFGALACLLFTARVGAHLTLADPWSAAFVTGGVLALGHWPLRHPAIGLTFLAISAGVMR